MSGHIGVAKAGLVIGGLTGGWHVCWSIFVAIGIAQPVIDFVFWMHFIKPVYVIEPFELGRAAVLVVVTGLLGFAIGSAFALVWNIGRKP